MSLSIHKLLSVSLLLATSATFVSVGHASVDEGSPTGRIGRRSRAQLSRPGAALSDVSSVPMAKEVKGGKGSGVTIRPPRRSAAIIFPTQVAVDSTGAQPSAPPATAPSPTTSAPLAAAAAASVPARDADPTDEGVSAAVVAHSGAPALATSTTNDLIAAESAEPALPFGALTGSGAKGEDDDPALPEAPPSSPVSATPPTPPALEAGGDDEGERVSVGWDGSAPPLAPTAAAPSDAPPLSVLFSSIYRAPATPTVATAASALAAAGDGSTTPLPASTTTTPSPDGPNADDDGEGEDDSDRDGKEKSGKAATAKDDEFQKLDEVSPVTLEGLVAELVKVEKTDAARAKQLTEEATRLLGAQLTAEAEAYRIARLAEAETFELPYSVVVHPYSTAKSREFNSFYGFMTNGFYNIHSTQPATSATAAAAASEPAPASAAASATPPSDPQPSPSAGSDSAAAAATSGSATITAASDPQPSTSVASAEAPSDPYSFEARYQRSAEWLRNAILEKMREKSRRDAAIASRSDGVLDTLKAASEMLGKQIESYHMLSGETLFLFNITHKFMVYTTEAIQTLKESEAALEALAANETNERIGTAYQLAIKTQTKQIAALKAQLLTVEALMHALYPHWRDPGFVVPFTFGLLSIPCLTSPNSDRGSVTGRSRLPSIWRITPEMLTDNVGDTEEHFKWCLRAIFVDPAFKLRAAMDARRIVLDTAPTATSGASAAAAAAADDAATCAGAAAAAASSDPAAGGASGEAAAALTSIPAEASREGVAAVGGSSVGDAATAPAASASPPAATAQTPTAGGGWFSWLGRRNEPAPAN